MDFHAIVQQLPDTTFGKEAIVRASEASNQKIKSSSVFWLINKMLDDNYINRVGRNQYTVNKDIKPHTIYYYKFSDSLHKIVSAIEEQYPLIEFQAWEAVQYNEFVNHLIAHNMYFIEVENMLCDTVFEFLRESSPRNILLKPDKNIFMRYAGHETIIVQNLISEAPNNKSNPHGVVVEKLLVDMLADKKIELFVEPAEFPFIWEEIFEKYVIDESRLMRYARRRNAEAKIRNFINEKTSIVLHSEETK